MDFQKERKSLEDLEYNDELALLSHFVNDIRKKSKRLEEVAASVGLGIKTGESKIMKVMRYASSHIGKWFSKISLT